MSGVGGIVSGVLGLEQANRLEDLAERAERPPQTATVEHFGQGLRAPFYEQLLALLADPSSIKDDPGYSAGIQAVERQGAAQGFLGSGNMMAELAEFGGSFYDRALARLSTLAGAGMTPTVVSGNPMAAILAQQASANIQSSALGSIGYGASGIISNGLFG